MDWVLIEIDGETFEECHTEDGMTTIRPVGSQVYTEAIDYKWPETKRIGNYTYYPPFIPYDPKEVYISDNIALSSFQPRIMILNKEEQQKLLDDAHYKGDDIEVVPWPEPIGMREVFIRDYRNAAGNNLSPMEAFSMVGKYGKPDLSPMEAFSALGEYHKPALNNHYVPMEGFSTIGEHRSQKQVEFHNKMCQLCSSGLKCDNSARVLVYGNPRHNPRQSQGTTDKELRNKVFGVPKSRKEKQQYGKGGKTI